MSDEFDEAWERQYAAGLALNRYPFDVVVSLTARYFGGDRPPAGLDVLDLGGGAGNHALFFARLGFNVTCVDVSETALRVAQERLAQEGLTARFRAMEFAAIDTLDSTFDLILDRGALCCADYDTLRTVVMPLVRGCMKPDGLLFSWFLSAEHPIPPTEASASGAYTVGGLRHTSHGDPLRLTRLDRRGIEELFGVLHIVQLYHLRRDELLVGPGEPPLGASAEYVVVCRRDPAPDR